MSLSDVILGRPLASKEAEKEELTVVTGVPVLGLDALASTAYGPEAALTVLLLLGVAGLQYLPWITLVIVAKLLTLYFSCRRPLPGAAGGSSSRMESSFSRSSPVRCSSSSEASRMH